jgi:hypothetical protein
MAKSIKPTDLGEAIAEQLRFYGEDVVEAVNAAGESAAKKLVKLTKKSAPKRTGDYRKSITYTTKENTASGDKEYTWGAKAPHHRLTHLLVKGHPTSTGGRTKADPFLADALDVVLPEYEREVEEALKNAK